MALSCACRAKSMALARKDEGRNCGWPTVTTDKLLDRLEVQHAVYNIKGTYISSSLDYARTEFTERIGVRLDRPWPRRSTAKHSKCGASRGSTAS